MKIKGFSAGMSASLALHAGVIAALALYSTSHEASYEVTTGPQMVEVSLLQELPQNTAAPAIVPEKIEVKKETKKKPEPVVKQTEALVKDKAEEVKQEEPVQAASAAAAVSDSVASESAEPASGKAAAQSDVVFDAAYLNNPPPSYPAAAKRRNIEGTVVLGVDVLATGRAAHITIHRSSGSEILDLAALEAVAQWKFIPAKVGGQAIASSVRVPIIFSIK